MATQKDVPRIALSLPGAVQVPDVGALVPKVDPASLLPHLGSAIPKLPLGGVTKTLTPKEIRSDYEANTGHAIVRRFVKLDPLHLPGVLVAGHAPFCWGATPTDAAHAAVVIEEIAALATHTIAANPTARAISKDLHDKHFLRKHGPKAYYGQPKA